MIANPKTRNLPVQSGNWLSKNCQLTGKLTVGSRTINNVNHIPAILYEICSH